MLSEVAERKGEVENIKGIITVGPVQGILPGDNQGSVPV